MTTLLSWPTWLIHLFTVTEWFAAIVLFVRYGRLVGRTDVVIFGYAMMPHLCGGLAILLYHLGGDHHATVLDLSRVFTLVGSLALFAAVVGILLRSLGRASTLPWLVVPLGLVWPIAIGLETGALSEVARVCFATANLIYLAFLIVLLFVYRIDKVPFSLLTVVGFWFLLAFVAATLTGIYIVDNIKGLPSLSHDDLLHGATEGLLSLSNLMIALGVYRQINRVRGGLVGLAV